MASFAICADPWPGWGPVPEAMRQAGIPAVVNERDGYFEAQEIQLLLALLSIIDNPEQDLPMAAVLHSGLVGLDANELGALRLSGEGSLWSLMPAYAEEAQDERLLSLYWTYGALAYLVASSRRDRFTMGYLRISRLRKLCGAYAEWSCASCKCARLI